MTMTYPPTTPCQLDALESRRLLSGGTPDPSFAGGGSVELPVAVERLHGGEAGQPVLGVGPDALVRLKPDGTLDASFDGDGVYAEPAGRGIDAAGFNTVSKRTAYVSGRRDAGDNRSTYLTVLDESGAPVAGFGDAGTVDLTGIAVGDSEYSPVVETGRQVLVREDGGVYVFGTVDFGEYEETDGRILSFDAEGNLLGTLTGRYRYQSYGFNEISLADGDDLYVEGSSDGEYSSYVSLNRYDVDLTLLNDDAIFGGSVGAFGNERLLDVSRRPVGGSAHLVVLSDVGGSTSQNLEQDVQYAVRFGEHAVGTDLASTVSTPDDDPESRIFYGRDDTVSRELAPRQGVLLADRSYVVGNLDAGGGNVSARHFTPDGRLDTTYGVDGTFSRTVRGTHLADDGSILILVDADGDGLEEVARYTAPDLSFTRLELGDDYASPTILGSAYPDEVSVTLRESDGRVVIRTADVVRSIPANKLRTINFLGLGGDDVLTVGAGVVARVWSRLGDGNDRVNLAGSVEAAYVEGGLGNDTIFTGDGDDTVFGEAGNDYIIGGAGVDRLYGMGGNDFLIGGRGDDRLEGGSGNDRLDGSAGNDDLFGHAGDDTLGGSKGSDRLFGGRGADFNGGGDGDDAAEDDDADLYERVERLL